MASASSPKCIPCLAKIATSIIPCSSDEKESFLCGCKIIDLTFQTAVISQIGEIHLTNFYTALFTLRVKLKEDVNPMVTKWRTCIRRLRLMPEPHCESGSHDSYVLTSKQFSFDLLNVTEVRLILQQPSPAWKDFSLSDIVLYKSPLNAPTQAPLPSWLTTDVKAQPKHANCPGNIEQLSSHLLSMWGLTEHVGDGQTSRSMGRYDVNGCYDVSLLNFT